jgi:hypothetical protein
MIVRTGSDYLDISVKEQIPRGQHGRGDVEFRIRVRVSGPDTEFVADTSPWVVSESLAQFVSELRRLESERAGAAMLVSISPGELTLEVGIVGRAGHVAVSGQVGRHLYMRDQLVWCALPFDLPLSDPTELSALVAEFEALLST